MNTVAIARSAAALSKEDWANIAHVNRAHELLACGVFEEGWELYEARLDKEKLSYFSKPQWQGQSLEGKTLLLWGEGGHGDAIFFSRYVPMLERFVWSAGGRLVWCVFEKLYSLFRSSFPNMEDGIYSGNGIVPYDYHCPIGSLPLRFGTGLDTIPDRVPYLSPDAAKGAQWCNRLGSRNKLRVALSWTGDPQHLRNSERSIDLQLLAQYLDVEGVEFYSAQVGRCCALAESGLRYTIDYTSHLKDFEDTAAFLSNMDLVISTCTATAHLAGALALPTWVLLPKLAYWMWCGKDPDSCAWYPVSRVYRQEKAGDWTSVLERVRYGLVRAVGGPPNSPGPAPVSHPPERTGAGL